MKKIVKNIATGALPVMQPNEISGTNIFQRLSVGNLPQECTEVIKN